MKNLDLSGLRMKKQFDYWNFRFSLDDFFYEVTNILLKIVFFFNNILGKNEFMKKNIELYNIHNNERVFILGNGPSIKQQNLKLLKDEIVFAVNSGYKHIDYEYIQPKYHVIVDPKLAIGIWDISILDEILLKNPKVIFLLNSKWYRLDKFQPYIKDQRFKIYWLNTSLFFTSYYKKREINLVNITYGGAVLGKSIFSAVYTGAKNIYLLGVESTGFCSEVLKEETHFYGVNKENKNKDIVVIYKDFYFNYIYLKNLYHFSQYAKDKNYSVINCSVGGILNMFDRQKYEEVLNSKESLND